MNLCNTYSRVQTIVISELSLMSQGIDSFRKRMNEWEMMFYSKNESSYSCSYEAKSKIVKGGFVKSHLSIVKFRTKKIS